MRLAPAFLALALAAPLSACAEVPPPPVTVPLAPAPESPDAAPPPAARSVPAKPAARPADLPTEIPGTSIRFTGGDGSSAEQAIVIEGARGEVDGVQSEYQYLQMRLGPREGWKRTKQSLVERNGRKYDVLEVDREGHAVSYWFDITLYFGKF